MPALARAAGLRGVAIALACASIGLGACAGSRGHTGRGPAKASLTYPTRVRSRAPERPGASRVIVARVGRTAISLAEVRHLMAIQSAPDPVPDPPAFADCANRLRGSDPGAGIAALKRSCARRYAQLLQDAVSRAVHAQWLIGQAREEGVRASSAEIEREFQASRGSLGSNAEFRAYLRRMGETVADMKLELRLSRLADGIFAKVRKGERPPGAAEVLAYYRAHRPEFVEPEERDVRIVRTTTKASALRIRRELEAGRSFAAAERELSAIGQPIGARDGEVPGLKPGVFEEDPLNRAIFSARMHELHGPLEVTAAHATIPAETNSGWFLFEVTGRRPPHLLSVTRVGGSIARRLAGRRRDRTLAGYVASFRRKWRARTSCEPGYVVVNCRQFASRAAVGSEDPYTL